MALSKLVHDLSEKRGPQVVELSAEEEAALVARQVAEDAAAAAEAARLAARDYADRRRARYHQDLTVNQGDNEPDVVWHVLDMALQAIAALKAEADALRDIVAALQPAVEAQSGPLVVDARADLALGELDEVLIKIAAVKRDIPKP